MVRRTFTVREKFYIFAAWAIAGVLLICAAYFTYANNFSRLSFSIADNDIYEVDEDLTDAGIIDNNKYYIRVFVDLRRTDNRYIRIIAEGITNSDTIVWIYTGNVNEKGETFVNNSIEGNSLVNGENDFALVDPDFSYFDIYITGEDHLVVKSVQFRESTEDHPVSDAVPFMIVVGMAYIITPCFAFVLGKKRKMARASQ